MFKLLVVILVVAIRNYASGNTTTTEKPGTTPEPPTDYCDPKLCYGKWIHIGCRAGMDQPIPENCGGTISIPVMDEKRKKHILDVHNFIRDKVAAGNHLRFDKAAKMGVVQWDEELAKLAALNLHSCVAQTDTCRNTKKFPMVGQNVALTLYSSRVEEDIDDLIEHQIMLWFNHSIFVSMTDIRHLRKPGPMDFKRFHIDTFTQLVQDRLKYIGCAAMIRQTAETVLHTLCCNYSFRNLITKQVYKVSSVIGDGCTAKDKKYTALCTKDQVYEDLPNVYY